MKNIKAEAYLFGWHVADIRADINQAWSDRTPHEQPFEGDRC